MRKGFAVLLLTPLMCLSTAYGQKKIADAGSKKKKRADVVCKLRADRKITRAANEQVLLHLANIYPESKCIVRSKVSGNGNKVYLNADYFLENSTFTPNFGIESLGPKIVNAETAGVRGLEPRLKVVGFCKHPDGSKTILQNNKESYFDQVGPTVLSRCKVTGNRK